MCDKESGDISDTFAEEAEPDPGDRLDLSPDDPRTDEGPPAYLSNGETTARNATGDAVPTMPVALPVEVAAVPPTSGGATTEAGAGEETATKGAETGGEPIELSAACFAALPSAVSNVLTRSSNS